jgi:hypothetical protein
MARKKGFYTVEPVAPPKKIADKAAFPTPEVGKGPASTVPSSPGGSTGFAGTTSHRFTPPKAVRAHHFGHHPHQQSGFLRLSGLTKAHRIGKR